MPRNSATRCQRQSLLHLNDDCLELICQQLDICDQYTLRCLHPRLCAVVEGLWRTRLHGIVHLTTEDWPQQSGLARPQAFVEFMVALQPYMTCLALRLRRVTSLRWLSDCEFPAMTAFEFSLEISPQHQSKASDELAENDQVEDPDEEETDADGARHAVASEGADEIAYQFVDEDVSMLQQVFPNLRVLKLSNCQLTGRHIDQLHCLRQLRLDRCQCLESEHFREIFQRLRLRKLDIMVDCDEVNCCDLVELKRCPTLEHIKIADYHLCFDTDIINDLLRLPQLRKLSVYSKNFVFDVVERISRSRIKTIEAFKFNGALNNFERLVGELGHMSRLRKLAFHNCRGNDTEEGIRNHMLQRVAAELSELREIHLCACELESEAGLLHFVSHCRQLEAINLTGTRGIGRSFVWRCVELLKRQKWRTAPLRICLLGTDVDASVLTDARLLAFGDLLRLSWKSRALDDTKPMGVLKFTFAI